MPLTHAGRHGARTRVHDTHDHGAAQPCVIDGGPGSGKSTLADRLAQVRFFINTIRKYSCINTLHKENSHG